jgi:putative chitinase
VNALKSLLAFVASRLGKQPAKLEPLEATIEPEPFSPPSAVVEKAAGVRLSGEVVAKATGATFARALEYLPYLEAAMSEFEINTASRQAMFLAQIGHESGGLRYTTEIWGPTPAQSRYEGRKDLGNVQPGDGYKFRGRGLIQTTGRYNYEATGKALGVDLLSNPEALAKPTFSARSAAWFWMTKGLNQIADKGDNLAATKRINGGTNGLSDRQALYTAAMRALT